MGIRPVFGADKGFSCPLIWSQEFSCRSLRNIHLPCLQARKGLSFGWGKPALRWCCAECSVDAFGFCGLLLWTLRSEDRVFFLNL